MTQTPDMQIELDRMASYRAFAGAFSYPGPALLELWPDQSGRQQELAAEYDRLFRAAGLWLYGAEHLVENEFQRARMLADVMGFYRAFGIEPDRERPDALACELEFMRCLILKRIRVACQAKADPGGEKADVCRQAERRFFVDHLAPAVAQIAPKVQARAAHPFYRQVAQEVMAFIEAERAYLGADETARAVRPDRQETPWEGCS